MKDPISQNIDNLSDIQLLCNLQLIKNHELTVASLVLLGSKDGLAKHLPYAEVRYAYRLTENELRNQDSEIFSGGYLLYYNALWNKINSRNITLNIPHGLLLVERKAFEEDTIREAVNNAIMHRDYQSAETIFIFQYPTLFEIKNPGELVEGIDLENIRTESKVRNKLIADILFRCEFVEQFGTGVNLMFKNQLLLGKNPPDYYLSDHHRVVLKLNGSIQDVEFAKYVLKIVDEKQKNFSDDELISLYKRRHSQRKIYKELLLKRLKELPEGAKKQELQGLLPQLKWLQIWRLLQKLRVEGKITFIGSRRSKAGVYKLI